MGLKIWCQVGEWGPWISKLPYSREFSKMWFQKLSFFFLFLIGFIIFLKNLKNRFCYANLKKVGVTFFLFFIELIRFYIQTCINLRPPPLIHTHPNFLHMILERIWIWCHVWGGSQNFLFSRGWGHKIWVLVGGFNCADWTVHFSDWATTMSLRGPATQHLHNEARRAESDGTGWTGGRVDGLDGRQNCPSIFFILCMYIDYVYIYLYTK